MTLPPRPIRWLVLLVAISLQGQALAGLLAPCLHQGEAPAVADHGPCHPLEAAARDSRQADSGGESTHCVKCGLVCHHGASHPPAAWMHIISYVVPGPAVRAPDVRPDRFIAEPLPRPPIPPSV